MITNLNKAIRESVSQRFTAQIPEVPFTAAIPDDLTKAFVLLSQIRKKSDGDADGQGFLVDLTFSVYGDPNYLTFTQVDEHLAKITSVMSVTTDNDPLPSFSLPGYRVVKTLYKEDFCVGAQKGPYGEINFELEVKENV